MDGFDMDSFKSEKSTAMRRFRRLRTVARLFRFVEVCAAMALLAWLWARAPLAVKASGHYFRRIFAAVASPIFMFFLGNAIIVALFVKSGQLSRSSPAAAEDEFYDELRSDVPAEEQAPAVKEIVFQDKEIICEEVVKSWAPEEDSVEKARVSCSELSDLRLYRRSQSENMERANCVEESRSCNEILRRSKTDVCQKPANVFIAGRSEQEEYLENGMSNEEFRRTIEEFIAKQVKFHREESHSVVVHTHA